MSLAIKSVGEARLTALIAGLTDERLSAREIELIDQCQNLSFDIYSGTADGRLVCAWGIIPPSLLSSQVYLWLYTTKDIKNHQFFFVRHSQRIVEVLLEEYEAIVGHVSKDAKDSKRWLKWLGATFGPPENGRQTFRIGRKWDRK